MFTSTSGPAPAFGSCTTTPPTGNNVNLPLYFRRVGHGRWVVRGTAYALELLPCGTYQFFSKGKPVFTVGSLLEAEQALADLLEGGLAS